MYVRIPRSWLQITHVLDTSFHNANVLVTTVIYPLYLTVNNFIVVTVNMVVLVIIDKLSLSCLAIGNSQPK